MFNILMLVLDNFILSLGFCSQDNYLPRNKERYESFHNMIDPTTIILIWIFTQTQKRADMTSRLIGSGLFNHPSSPVRAKEERYKWQDLFSCQVTDCSAITSHHPRLTGRFVGGGTPLQRCSQHILQPQLTVRE